MATSRMARSAAVTTALHRSSDAVAAPTAGGLVAGVGDGDEHVAQRPRGQRGDAGPEPVALVGQVGDGW